MRRAKLFLTILAVACSMCGALLAISASALPSVLPENTAERTWSGASIGDTTLEASNGARLSCTRAMTTGTEEVKRPLGLFHITFTGCSGPLETFRCTGLGDSEATILALGSWHLVYDTLGATLGQAGIAYLFLLGAIHYECAFTLIVVSIGGMLCLVTKPTTSTSTHEYSCGRGASAGQAKERTYYDAGGTLTTIATLLVEEASNGTPQNVVLIFDGSTTYAVAVELMN
jgi:hypothetical protein